MNKPNVDREEINKFTGNAAHWWDPLGEYKPLHEINPLRLNYIQTHTSLVDKQVLDVGCGGGILSESMAKAGAIVTGIDMSEAALETAKLRQLETQTNIEYIFTTIEALANERPNTYDVITCLEMIEHVPQPESVVQACAKLVKPGGNVFFSTLNRNLKSYLFAIIGAEYILKLLPRHTHDYAKFVKPAELTLWARESNLQIQHLKGLGYHILTKQYYLTDDISVNYLAHFIKS